MKFKIFIILPTLTMFHTVTYLFGKANQCQLKTSLAFCMTACFMSVGLSLKALICFIKWQKGLYLMSTVVPLYHLITDNGEWTY